MSKSLIDKIKFFWGFESAEDDLSEENMVAQTAPVEENKRFYSRPERSQQPSSAARNRVVNIHNSADFKIDVYQPHSFEDAAEVVECLRSRRPVIVNLEQADAELARKIFDFLSGALCALDGKAEKISKAIFLMAPSNVQIANIKNVLHTASGTADAPSFSLTD